MRRKSRRENPSQKRERGEVEPETVSIPKSNPTRRPGQSREDTRSRGRVGRQRGQEGAWTTDEHEWGTGPSRSRFVPILEPRPRHPADALRWRGKVLLARLCVQQPSAGTRERAPPGFAYSNCASTLTSRGSVEGQGPPCPIVRPPDHRRARGSLPLQASPIQTVRPHSPHAVVWRGKVLPTIALTSSSQTCLPFPPCGESIVTSLPSLLERGCVSHRHSPVYSFGEWKCPRSCRFFVGSW